MEKQNQRIMLTKQLIHAAFLRLLRSKGIREISIRELCDEAGINRTTFYNHYGSSIKKAGRENILLSNSNEQFRDGRILDARNCCVATLSENSDFVVTTHKSSDFL